MEMDKGKRRLRMQIRNWGGFQTMITDTNGDLFPEGTYRFRVSEPPFEVDVKGYQAWQWSFDVEMQEGLRDYNERFMVWLLAPLLRGLGFPEVTPGRFEWEPV